MFGLSSCGAWAYLSLGMWDLSFPTRDPTYVPCIGRQILNCHQGSPRMFAFLRKDLEEMDEPQIREPEGQSWEGSPTLSSGFGRGSSPWARAGFVGWRWVCSPGLGAQGEMA